MTAEPPASALPQHAAAARTLIHAAQTAASAWAQPLDPHAHTRAVRQFYSTLRDLSIATRGLAGWQAGGSPEAADFRQQFVAASQALGEAVRSLDGVLAAEGLGPVQNGSEPGTALHQAARQAIIAWRQPPGVASSREETTGQLMTAITALIRAADSLARGAPQPRIAQLHAVRAALGDAKSCLADALHTGLTASAKPDTREAE